MQNLEPVEPTAAQYIAALKAHQSSGQLKKILNYFKTGDGEYAEGDAFMGVSLEQVTKISKRFVDMEITEIEKLLESPMHEVRAGALSIMDQQARRKNTSETHRHELFRLYIRRLDRINNWDLVDKGAPHVIGHYLVDRPRDILHRLARSPDLWHRRTAIIATTPFIKNGDLDDTYQIAHILLDDHEDLIHKATGWMLREAGKKDPERLHRFLDEHAPLMPRTMLRATIEHLEPEKREHYMQLEKTSGQQAAPKKSTKKTGSKPRAAPAKKAAKKTTKKPTPGAKKKPSAKKSGTQTKKASTPKAAKKPRKAAKKTQKTRNKSGQ